MTDPVRIPLPRGFITLVDPADEARVREYSWHLKAATAWPGRYYAQRTVRLTPGRKGKKTSVALHRFIVDAKTGDTVDHINGDTLDNRRSNLRICTARENSTNVVHSKNRKRGGFKGVNWNRHAQKWEAGICAGPIKSNGKRARLYLGLFADPADAARVYDAAALKHFGEFAALNFPIEPEEGRAAS